MSGLSSFLNAFGAMLSSTSVAVFCIIAIVIDETDASRRPGRAARLKNWRKRTLVPFVGGVLVQGVGVAMLLFPGSGASIAAPSGSASSANDSPYRVDQTESRKEGGSPRLDSTNGPSREVVSPDANGAAREVKGHMAP